MSGAKYPRVPLPPGAAIGILGGGQLGRMLALAGARLGLRTHIYSDNRDAPAFQVAEAGTIGSYDDKPALEAFARSCDAVTFEFENVPNGTAEYLSRHVLVAPSPQTLKITQDRHLEKNFVAGLGIATAAFHTASSDSEVRDAFRALGSLSVLKTCRLGYDGKGQEKVGSEDEAAAAFRKLGSVPAILERYVDFSFEVSVIAARGCDGTFVAYDPPRNEHENHILRRSTVPSPLPTPKVEEATVIARKIAEALDYVGVLGVELFVGRDGTLAVNEIAPRVHNSGHWTIDACVTSQFEQHMRAVAGWPLGNAARHSDAVMENIIGAEAENWSELAKKPAGLHLYGKGVALPGRKMGHITRIAPRGSEPSR